MIGLVCGRTKSVRSVKKGGNCYEIYRKSSHYHGLWRRYRTGCRCSFFAREGAKVVVNSVTEKSGAETLALVEKQGGEGIYVQGDVSKSEDVKKIVAATIGRFGTVDVLVNVAGIVIAGRADNTREEDWDKMMDVNAKGTL